ncbi:MAG: glycoside hydrolase [Clostridiales bacterium]|nr:glycoside hydrolase [Clostridiales bacterium]
MNQMKITMLNDEFWYGLSVHDGTNMPLNKESRFTINIDPNTTVNQAAPFLVSNQGRYVWCDDGFIVTVADGEIVISYRKKEPLFSQGHQTLKGAYLAASKKHFPPSGKTPPEDFFQGAQFNTWIELLYEQTQEGILAYGQAVIDEGYPPGVLMIDDGWMEDYGVWKFHNKRIPEPKKMIDSLHQMGFKVMLWTCPFISPDSAAYRELVGKGKAGGLLFTKEGKPAIREWWNGYSAVLDLSHPEAQRWYKAQNQYLMDEYGVDGFKFDAGDGKFYQDDDQFYEKIDANGQTLAWAEFGLEYAYNEYRACYRAGNQPLVQRLADKNHSWDGHGVGGLIPNHLTQGILGYAFSCPDMIGGGEYANFTENSENLDEELFVRYAQCAALMPMMQFSAAPWRVLTKENAALCKNAADTRNRFTEEIYALAKHSAESGEPITRYMEYQFPHQGFADINDQFMLGEKILVAPVCHKGETQRKVHLPEGKWMYVDGKRYEGGKVITVKAERNIIPYFILNR